jgi:glycerophosphoryl diester phosphodiesterase
MHTPKIFAHRGASAQAPMNTLPAFELAATLGADGIELDVRKTKDGAIVVIHDNTVDATTNGTGRVADLTLAEIQALNAGKGARVPTLSEVFTAVGERFACINVEIKEIGIEADTIACIKEHQMADIVLISSFEVAVLHECKRLCPEIPVAYLFAQPETMPEADNWEIIHPYYLWANTEHLARWQEAGKTINVWTVNAPEDIRNMIALGVDGIITDVPDVARRAHARP